MAHNTRTEASLKASTVGLARNANTHAYKYNGVSRRTFVVNTSVIAKLKSYGAF